MELTKTRESQEVKRGKKKKNKANSAFNVLVAKGRIKVDLTHTKYPVIRECANEMGWEDILLKKETEIEEKKRKPEMVDLYWHDLAIESSKLSSMKRFQRVNHFPAMNGITNKSSLSTILNNVKDFFPQDYHFFPDTWNIPL